jgi:hypothetical protein
VVPRLKGDSLVNARKTLGRAHCTLGNVVRPSRRHGRLVVRSQSVAAGRDIGEGSSVSVRLGPPPNRPKHRRQ